VRLRIGCGSGLTSVYWQMLDEFSGRRLISLARHMPFMTFRMYLVKLIRPVELIWGPTLWSIAVKGQSQLLDA
jgi:hypothetical protein